MAVKIRLRRTGKRNQPSHRVVVADSRKARNGRFIETIGYLDSRNSSEKIDLERAEYWLSVGAQPSESVQQLLERARNSTSLAEKKGRVEGKTFVLEGEPPKKKEQAVSEEEDTDVDTAEAAGEETAEAEDTEAEDTEENQQ